MKFQGFDDGKTIAKLINRDDLKMSILTENFQKRKFWRELKIQVFLK